MEFQARVSQSSMARAVLRPAAAVLAATSTAPRQHTALQPVLHAERSIFGRPPRAAVNGLSKVTPRLGRRWRSGRRRSKGSAGESEAEREEYLQRLSAVSDAVDPDLLEDIERSKLGRRHGCYNLKASTMRRRQVVNAAIVAAMLNEHDPLPTLESSLPEVALAGRSNSGKSSLLNALCGINPSLGTASTSDTPGWTKSIHFFEMTEVDEDDPCLVLVDLPGYGPASAATSARTKLGWSKLIRKYVREREELRSVFLLIESSVGVTADDHTFMSRLDDLVQPFHVIMTKADLLPAMQLAQSYALVYDDVTSRHPLYAGGDIPMCSSKNGTGIFELWVRLRTGIEMYVNDVEEDPDPEQPHTLYDGRDAR